MASQAEKNATSVWSFGRQVGPQTCSVGLGIALAPERAATRTSFVGKKYRTVRGVTRGASAPVVQVRTHRVGPEPTLRCGRACQREVDDNEYQGLHEQSFLTHNIQELTAYSDNGNS